jgi:hypothetical protein
MLRNLARSKLLLLMVLAMALIAMRHKLPFCRPAPPPAAPAPAPYAPPPAAPAPYALSYAAPAPPPAAPPPAAPHPQAASADTLNGRGDALAHVQHLEACTRAEEVYGQDGDCKAEHASSRARVPPTSATSSLNDACPTLDDGAGSRGSDGAAAAAEALVCTGWHVAAHDEQRVGAADGRHASPVVRFLEGDGGAVSSEHTSEEAASPGEAGRAPAPQAPTSFASQSIKPKIPGALRCLVAEAVREFRMIGSGDKVLVGLSGGKDSLTMLHVLLELKRRSPVPFEIAAATVDPQTPEYDPSPLAAYMAQLGVRYHMLRKPIIEMAKASMDPKRPSLCSFCSRIKRGLLYSCMREHGYTCLALGQHLDDGSAPLLPLVPLCRSKHAILPRRARRLLPRPDACSLMLPLCGQWWSRSS